MVSGHAHFGNIKDRLWIIKHSSGEADWDTVENELDSMIDELPFVIEDDRGVFLSQREFGERLVSYLEGECCMNPQWFKESLDHVDNQVWRDRGLSPPRS